jgi:hypothetical protein
MMAGGSDGETATEADTNVGTEDSFAAFGDIIAPAGGVVVPPLGSLRPDYVSSGANDWDLGVDALADQMVDQWAVGMDEQAGAEGEGAPAAPTE